LTRKRLHEATQFIHRHRQVAQATTIVVLSDCPNAGDCNNDAHNYTQCAIRSKQFDPGYQGRVPETTFNDSGLLSRLAHLR